MNKQPEIDLYVNSSAMSKEDEDAINKFIQADKLNRSEFSERSSPNTIQRSHKTPRKNKATA